MPNPEQEVLQNPAPQEPAPLGDFEEDLDHVRDALFAQKTMEDIYWFTGEYYYKNMLESYGNEFPEAQRTAYGFTASGVTDPDEKVVRRSMDREIAEKVGTWSIDEFKGGFRALGAIEARLMTLGGKSYDEIEKALGEDEADLDAKTYYTYINSALGSRTSTMLERNVTMRGRLRDRLRDIFERDFDYRTMTIRQFAGRMGIPYDRIQQLPAQDEDKPYNFCRRTHPEDSEEEIKEDTLNRFTQMFATVFMTDGLDAELGNMTEEQRRLYAQGQKASRQANTMEAAVNAIEPWVESTGEPLCEKLRNTGRISSMKESRRITQLSGTINFRSPGWLDEKLKEESERLKFVPEIMHGLKTPEQAQQEIVKKANKRFFVESLRKYPKETPAVRTPDNYILLHTGSRAGKTPEEMVENLAKCLAAASLKERNQPFNKKNVNTAAKYFREIYALDALAVCREANGNLTVRTDKIIGNINRIRNHNDPAAWDFIDPNRLSEYYGATHSQRSALDYHRPAAGRQGEASESVAVEDIQAPVVSAMPNIPNTKNIPKTPLIPRIPHM